MKKEVIEKLLLHKEEDVKKLAKEFVDITNHSYYNSIKTMMSQLEDWNGQLEITTDAQGAVRNRIDLFADKDSREFERAIKIFDKLLDFNETIEKMKLKLSPEEEKQLKKQVADTTYEKALDEIKTKK